MPTDYDFRIHHYGISSEGVQSNIGLLERFGFIDEEMDTTGRGNSYSIFAAKKFARLPEIENFAALATELKVSSRLFLNLPQPLTPTVMPASITKVL